MKIVSHVGFHKDVFKPSLLKSTAVFLVFVFAWTNMGLYQAVYAAENSKESKASSSIPLKIRGTEGSYDSLQGEGARGLESIVKRIRERAGKVEVIVQQAQVRQQGTEIASQKAAFQNEKSELEQADITIRSQFKQTEQRIKGLPSVIQQRQKAFEKKYEANFAQLKSKLDSINTAKTNSEFTLRTRRLKAFLDKIKPRGYIKFS